MQLVKLFETKDFDNETFEALLEADVVVIDGTGEYTVGYFVNEAITHGEHVNELWVKFDDLLKSQGASDHETVLIHHGSFTLFPEYLF